MDTSRKIPITPAPIQIQDNIPAPQISGRGISRQFPVEDLEVGQSFFVPDSMTEGLKGNALGIVRGAAYRVAERLGRQYVVKLSTESGVKGARCWRTR